MKPFVQMKSAVTVEHENGLVIAHRAGDVVAVSELAPRIVEQLEAGDEWLDSLLLQVDENVAEAVEARKAEVEKEAVLPVVEDDPSTENPVVAQAKRRKKSTGAGT